MSEQKPDWWEPKLVDAAYLQRLRDDYPEDAILSDDALRERYDCTERYAVLWDHLGDAYEEYEHLADDWLALKAKLAKCEEALRPFAKIGNGIPNNWINGHLPLVLEECGKSMRIRSGHCERPQGFPTLDDFRRAAEVLNPKE